MANRKWSRFKSCSLICLAYNSIVMEIIFPALFAVIAIVAVGWWVRRSVLLAVRREPETQSLMLLQNQVNASATRTAEQVENLQKRLGDEMRRMNEQVSQAMLEANRTVGDRLDNATRVIGDVRQRLGQLDEASKRVFDVGKEIADLQQTLRAPKLRGSMGEYMLAELLAQVLPEKSFEEQYRFKGGEVVDAVIKLSAGMVVIDAKFPLENFRRILSAAGEEDKREAGKLFVRDVKKHIDDIAGKYIRTDEGTFDFAMMYIPAENVYYEIVLRNEWSSGDPLFGYALSRRVIPVSPNSFYAYLQTILLGLKGMRVEESAREMMGHLSRLAKEMDGFMEEFRLVGQHMGNAVKKFSEAEKRLGRVESKIEDMTGSSRTLQHGQAQSLPPADSAG